MTELNDYILRMSHSLHLFWRFFSTDPKQEDHADKRNQRPNDQHIEIFRIGMIGDLHKREIPFRFWQVDYTIFN